MSSLTFREVLKILKDNGFEEVRCKGSHGRFEATVDGKLRKVTVQINKPKSEVKKNTLASIIRQSGLEKDLFK